MCCKIRQKAYKQPDCFQMVKLRIIPTLLIGPSKLRLSELLKIGIWPFQKVFCKLKIFGGTMVNSVDLSHWSNVWNDFFNMESATCNKNCLSFIREVSVQHCLSWRSAI